MPPRYAYWTILVDDQPTAFRAGAKEDLLPTFNRLKEKQPSAKMMWFQNGKLWPSRIDAQEAMRARGEMGRRGDERQGGFGSRDREFARDSGPRTGKRPEWKPKTFAAEGGESRRSSRPASEGGRSPEKLDWKPKGEFTPAPKRSERPTSRSEKPEWKPKGSFDRKPDRKPEWKPKGSFDRKAEWKPRTSRPHDLKTSRSAKLEWKPKTESGTRKPEVDTRAKRAWIPKAEYKKSLGIEAKRDDKWRPGGEHRDPRQKYKDAKKAKWTKFKKTIRTKWESKKKG